MAKNRAKALLDNQIFPVIHQFGSNVQETFAELKRSGETNLTELRIASDLSILLLRAQNDDAHAFDKLLELKATNQMVDLAVEQIAIACERVEILDARLTSIPNSDPWVGTTLSKTNAAYGDYVMRLHQPLNRYQRLELIKEMNANGRIPKYERLRFLARVLETADSLHIRTRAMRLLDAEAKLQWNLVLWRKYSEWFRSLPEPPK